MVEQLATLTLIAIMFEKNQAFLFRYLWKFLFWFTYFAIQWFFSYTFLWCFAREIGIWPAKIDPLAHARRLTAVFKVP